MPFDPNSPLMPAGADGIDDWFVPGQSPGRIAPWTPQTDHLFPDDWISPDNWNAPRPPTAPRTALPPPSPQPNATNPAISNRPAPPPDPFAAYWAVIPASRAGALAWQPPFFPSSNPLSLQNIPARVTPPPLFPNLLQQFPWEAPAPTNIPSDAAANGLPGGIPRMLAAQASDPAAGGLLGGIPKMLAAQASDPAAHGLLGGIAKMLAASAPGDVPPIAAGQGLLAASASLQPAAWNTQTGASYLPDPRPFLSPDPIGYRVSGPSYAYLRNDLLNGADPTGPARPPNDGNFDVASDTGQENASPNIHLVAGEEGEKEHDKLDPAVFTGLTDKGLTDSPKALPTLPPLLPIFPRPLLPPTSAPPPPPRASLPPPSSPPPVALPPASPGQAAASPRPSSTPIGPESVVLPNQQSDGDRGSRPYLPFGIGPGLYAGEPIPAGPGTRPNTRQQDQINTSGDENGCHTCGVRDPGTQSGNWIGDHQTPTALNPPGQQQYFLPHCWSCSRRQGGLVRSSIGRREK
jgi:hypothetical protein